MLACKFDSFILCNLILTDGYHSYRELARFRLACGESSKAVEYAKMELEVERYCIGIDTAHLEKDVKGAEFWLPHVMSEDAKLQAKQRAEEALQKKKVAEKTGKGKAKKGRWTIDGCTLACCRARRCLL